MCDMHMATMRKMRFLYFFSDSQFPVLDWQRFAAKNMIGQFLNTPAWIHVSLLVHSVCSMHVNVCVHVKFAHLGSHYGVIEWRSTALKRLLNI